jgi:hypothetical protein
LPDKIRFAAGPRCRILASVLAGIVSIGGTGGASAGIVDDWIRGFADSEIEFQRGNSNVPFIPIAFADVSFYNDMEVTEQWTLSAIMPWPAVLYSPTRDTLFRFGASPSGASWSLREPSGKVSFDLDSWDLVGLPGDRGPLAGIRDRPRVESLRPNRNQLPTGNNAIVVSGSR